MSLTVYTRDRLLVIAVAGTAVYAPDAGVKPCVFLVLESELVFLTTMVATTASSTCETDSSPALVAPVLVDYRRLLADARITEIDPGQCRVDFIQKIADDTFLRRLRGFAEKCTTPSLQALRMCTSPTAPSTPAAPVWTSSSPVLPLMSWPSSPASWPLLNPEC